MKKKIDPVIIVFICIAGVMWLYILLNLFFRFPIPRGSKVDDRYTTYYQNFLGIYYITVDNSLDLFFHGSWGYLDDVDESTFEVLAKCWAKDANHVWCLDEVVEDADIESFIINESGLPVDRHHVFVSDRNGDYVPSTAGIDPETAEYFVYRLEMLQDEWIRDKDFVYHHDKKIDVDRNSFQIYGEDWFIDKNFLYKTRYNSATRQWDLHCLDSIQSPIEAGYHYFRNGRNIIYGNSVLIKDIDVRRFEEIGHLKYRINDTLYERGKPFLKDSLDVKNAKFYFYGRIAADGKNVFFDHKRLDDIDAATFRQIDNETYEDKDYIYKMPEIRYRQKDFSFEKKKKK